MVDHDVRELERRYRASESHEDLTRWLVARHRAGELSDATGPWIERVVAGELTRDALALAAYLGDPAALELDDFEAVRVASYVSDDLEVVPLLFDEPGDARAWVAGLAEWDARWVVLAQFAAAEGLTGQLEATLQHATDDAYGVDEYGVDEYHARIARRSLAAGVDCLRDPTPAKLDVAREHMDHYDASPAVLSACAAAGLAYHYCRGDELKVLLGRLDLGPANLQIARAIRADLVPRVLAGLA